MQINGENVAIFWCKVYGVKAGITLFYDNGRQLRRQSMTIIFLNKNTLRSRSAT